MTACGECLVGRHSLCVAADVSDYFEVDDDGVQAVGKFCCCGQEWTTSQLTTEAEYSEYRREQEERGWTQHERPAASGDR
jgi:hypothetical protein